MLPKIALPSIGIAGIVLTVCVVLVIGIVLHTLGVPVVLLLIIAGCVLVANLAVIALVAFIAKKSLGR